MTERFSASVAAKHMACPASANLDLAIPNWTPPVEDRNADNAANRGTKKHEMLEPIMSLPATEIRWMAEYLAYIADLRATRRFKALVEQSFTATWLQGKPETKPDLVLFTQDELHIVDGKWGKIPVEVINNTQLLYYAVCAAPLAPKAKGVTLHILQPPVGSYESWFVDTTVLQKFMADAIAAEQRIINKDLTFMPGDHCKFCEANPHSRASAKGTPLCPAMLSILYPNNIDEDEILAL